MLNHLLNFMETPKKLGNNQWNKHLNVKFKEFI